MEIPSRGRPDTRRVLVWLIVVAASLEFILQALVAAERGRLAEGILWLLGFAVIVVVAYTIETIKATAGEYEP